MATAHGDSSAMNEREYVKWLESHLEGDVEDSFRRKFQQLTLAASSNNPPKDANTKLCSFVEECRDSKIPHLRELAVSDPVWLALYKLYLESNDGSQNRSMRNILKVLATLLVKNFSSTESAISKVTLAENLVAIVAEPRSLKDQVKAAFRLLEAFLAKKIFSPSDIVTPLKQHVQFPAASQDGSGLQNIWDLFRWLEAPEVAQAAAKFLVALMEQDRALAASQKGSSCVPGWTNWILHGLSRWPAAIDSVKAIILPSIRQNDYWGTEQLIEVLHSPKAKSRLDPMTHMLLQLAIVQVGKWQESPQLIRDSITDFKFRDGTIDSLLVHPEPVIRSSAFQALILSDKQTSAFPEAVLAMLKRRMPALHVEADAKLRGAILSYTKAMIYRLRGSMTALAKICQTHGSSPPSKAYLAHEAFVVWYITFLLGELIPTASYQRHIIALKALRYLLESGILDTDSNTKPHLNRNEASWPIRIGFFKSSSVRLLLDMLLDPFNDVRSNAAGILRLATRADFVKGCYSYIPLLRRTFPSPSHSHEHDLPSMTTSQVSSRIAITSPALDSTSPDLLECFASRAKEMSDRTGRADYANGSALSNLLLYSLKESASDQVHLVTQLVAELEDMCHIASTQGLEEAVARAPIHGAFSSLSLVWDSLDLRSDCTDDSPNIIKLHKETWDELQRRMLACCSSIWRSVEGILCSDSPEGHVPGEIEDEDFSNQFGVDTKDVLSYCFRAIIESSTLMSILVSKTQSRWDSMGKKVRVLPRGVFIDVGNLTFEQLSRLRHRGAFSTVASTFKNCCQMVLYQPEESDGVQRPDLLVQWYQEASKCIMQQTSKTRRSAGVPSLFTGILSADSSSVDFGDVIAELRRIASLPIDPATSNERLPQVHAMNSLKEIFKDASLKAKAEPHISVCLQLAANQLNSPEWPLRNCGILLLRSLVDSLFGTCESKTTTESGWDGLSPKISYDRYPDLPDLIYQLLDKDAFSGPSAGHLADAVQSVFPALDILRRAGPPKSHHAAFYKLVADLLGSKSWHVREIAARTLCTLSLHQEWLQSVLDLLPTGSFSSDRMHGVLMTVRLIFERRLELDQATSIDGLEQISCALNSGEIAPNFDRIHPEILAAYIDIFNTMAKILLASQSGGNASINQANNLIRKLFPGDPHEEYVKLMSSCIDQSKGSEEINDGNITLIRAITRRAILLDVARADYDSLSKTMDLAGRLSTNAGRDALQFLGDIMTEYDLRQNSLAIICNRMIACSEHLETAYLATDMLADVIDNQTKYKVEARDDIDLDSVKLSLSQWIATDSHAPLQSLELGNPYSTIVQIRISGLITYSDWRRSFPKSDVTPTRKSRNLKMMLWEDQMSTWGKLLSKIGTADNDFELRFSAVKALASFYHNVSPENLVAKLECAIPSLFALYDTLNDDDEEIRNLGAGVVSVMIGKNLLPIDACLELGRWIAKHQGQHGEFCISLVGRMVGFLPYYEGLEAAQLSTRKLFETALKEDDSLFVVEEPNLYIDAVREAQFWCSLYDELLSGDQPPDPAVRNLWAALQEFLSGFIIEGLTIMLGKIELETDGSLGWSSKPAVFALCMRVLLCANVVLKHPVGPRYDKNLGESLGTPQMRSILRLLGTFLEKGRANQIHPRLCFEVDGDPNLPWPRFVAKNPTYAVTSEILGPLSPDSVPDLIFDTRSSSDESKKV